MTIGTANLARSVTLWLERVPDLLSWARSRERRPGHAPGPLTALVESQIIPRLLVSHLALAQPAIPAPLADTEPTAEVRDVDRMVARALAADAGELAMEVERMLAAGRSAESVLVDVLAPAARRLAEVWAADACGFADVAMGLWRLQEIVQVVADRSAAGPVAAGPRVLLGSPPGQCHEFGLRLASQLFQRAGWLVHWPENGDPAVLVAAVADTPFDLVLLAVAPADDSLALAQLVQALKARSCRPDLKVILAGLPSGDAGRRLGADAAVSSVADAVSRAQDLRPPRPPALVG
ncbi:MAG: hypothetical protein NZM40_10320 [Sphingomonadaceae bacterium]|uniref:cobalamin B12-binding domain-containing protein n=1 Tax=Thermaurantiacus sp. TaxID=2820283 RepID=UPI00298ED5C5|nr:hypothetical protein [Thermaurantiacus sp.]MCS6987798.1 hypothetical protein [Sphingomonadaceae bacterium]MDW8414982.1 hypothetical protein [Thermaurantiacus sp.]